MIWFPSPNSLMRLHRHSEEHNDFDSTAHILEFVMDKQDLIRKATSVELVLHTVERPSVGFLSTCSCWNIPQKFYLNEIAFENQPCHSNLVFNKRKMSLNWKQKANKNLKWRCSVNGSSPWWTLTEWESYQGFFPLCPTLASFSPLGSAGLVSLPKFWLACQSWSLVCHRSDLWWRFCCFSVFSVSNNDARNKCLGDLAQWLSVYCSCKGHCVWFPVPLLGSWQLPVISSRSSDVLFLTPQAPGHTCTYQKPTLTHRI